jgi:RNA polymerase sigma-70 factor (ECF subfamily)
MDAAPPPSPVPHDLELVRAVLAGDEGSLERFLVHLARVPGIVRGRNQRLGGPLSEHELADVVQETFGAVWRKLAEFRGDAALDTWIHRFGWNELLKAIARKQRPERSLETHLERDAASAPSASDEPALDPVVLHACLQRLRAEEQDVLRAVHFEGSSLAEVAERARLPLGTVKTRYYRAIDKLRVALSGHWRRACL